MSGYYPPGVTGNEYAISGAQREWEEDERCPHCGWEGPMFHEQHYEFGIRAFCGNPDLVEVGLNEKGDFARYPCPLTTEGFEIEPPEPEVDWPE